jgi:hypothetical protein
MDKLRLGVSLTKNTANHSDKAGFSFSFFCDRCEKEWISPFVPFLNSGFSAIEHEEAKQMLWAQEHRAAFENANMEAHFHFSRCSVCGNVVCNECFSLECGDKCKECIGK